ncbi:hypothetical protein HDU96_004230, partial [Phlyctochytrium bullatum]
AIRKYYHFSCEWANRSEKTANALLDPHCLFVGKLNPNQVTEDLLRAKFAPFGDIRSIRLCHGTAQSPTPFSSEVQGVQVEDDQSDAFAFVRFYRAECAERAMDETNGTHWLGNTIKVKLREMSSTQQPRRPSSSLDVVPPTAYPAVASVMYGIAAQSPEPGFAGSAPFGFMGHGGEHEGGVETSVSPTEVMPMLPPPPPPVTPTAMGPLGMHGGFGGVGGLEGEGRVVPAPLEQMSPPAESPPSFIYVGYPVPMQDMRPGDMPRLHWGPFPMPPPHHPHHHPAQMPPPPPNVPLPVSPTSPVYPHGGVYSFYASPPFAPAGGGVPPPNPSPVVFEHQNGSGGGGFPGPITSQPYGPVAPPPPPPPPPGGGWMVAHPVPGASFVPPPHVAESNAMSSAVEGGGEPVRPPMPLTMPMPAVMIRGTVYYGQAALGMLYGPSSSAQAAAAAGGGGGAGAGGGFVVAEGNGGGAVGGGGGGGGG